MRSMAPVLLLAIAALAVWLLWPSVESVPIENEGSAPPAGGNAPSTRSAPSLTSDNSEASREHAAPGADERATPLEAPVDVRVVDWGTRAPVAAADVWWTRAITRHRIDVMSEADRARYRADPELMVRRFGQHATTDRLGGARVHADLEITEVLARRDDRVGWARLTMRNAGSGVALEISRQHALEVRVVDQAASPVSGVPVELCFLEAAAASQRETDDKGAIRFDYLEAWIGRDERGARRADAARVAVLVPGLHQCAASFSAISPPIEPLVLVLPATGEVQVHVSHAGRPIESLAARLWIGAADDREARNAAWRKDGEADGVIRFLPVPLLQSFQVEAEIGDLVLQRHVSGPATTGQVVRTTIEVPADAVALTGRLLFANGEPIVSTSVHLRCNLPRCDERMWLDTDAHGRFLWHPGAAPPGEPVRELTDFVVSLGRGAFEAIHGSVGRRTLQPGINDLGDIRLDYLPLVVAGSFRFDRPYASHVPIVVERWVGGDRRPSQGQWQVETEVFVYQESGRFLVRGALPPGRLRLRCGPHAQPVDFVFGQEKLVVRIAQGQRR